MIDDPLVVYADATEVLIERLQAHFVPWLLRSVEARIPGGWDRPERDRFMSQAVDVAEAACRSTLVDLRATLTQDVETQSIGPLGIVRRHLGGVTELLGNAGILEPERERFDREMFPEDRYDLFPANFSDVGDDVHEAGLIWGAAKAHVVLTRHKRG